MGPCLARAQPGASGAAPSTFSPWTGSQHGTGLSFTVLQLPSHAPAQAAQALEQGPCSWVLPLKCHQSCRQRCPGSIRGYAMSPAKSKGCKMLSAGLLLACIHTTLLPVAPSPQNLSPARPRCSAPIPTPSPGSKWDGRPVVPGASMGRVQCVPSANADCKHSGNCIFLKLGMQWRPQALWKVCTDRAAHSV